MYKVVRAPRKRARPMKGRLARKASKHGVRYEERKKKREEKKAAKKSRPSGVEGSKEYGKLSAKDQAKVSTAMRYNEFNSRVRAAQAASRKKNKS